MHINEPRFGQNKVKTIIRALISAHNHIISRKSRTVSPIFSNQIYLNSGCSGGSIEHPQHPKSPSDKDFGFLDLRKKGRGISRARRHFQILFTG